MRNDFTTNAVSISKPQGYFCKFRDNPTNLRREAYDMDGKVWYWVSAGVLMTMPRYERYDHLGLIGDAPWGAFLGEYYESL